MDASRDEVDGSSDASQNPRRSYQSQKHTDEQIQRLERVFNECTHPYEDVKRQLSRELGLSRRQVQFWFQNRRTQLKAQQEKAKIIALRAENDRIRCENDAMKEALEYKKCLSCRGSTTCINKQNLRVENAQLKEELRKVSSEVENYIGKPISFHQGSQGIASQGIPDRLEVPMGCIFGKSDNHVLDSNDSAGSRKEVK